MIQLTKDQTATLKNWFPDRPGSLVGQHVISTGYGSCWVDRWPNVRTVLVNIGHDYFLTGEPAVLTPTDLKQYVDGRVETPESFVPLLQTAFAGLEPFDRVVLEMHEKPRSSPRPSQVIRRLDFSDTGHLDSLSRAIRWIANSWGGSFGLASSGHAWGAFANGRLVSVACPF